MTMAEMLAIGVEHPGEGLFYRVRYDGFGIWNLELRRDRKRFGSVRVGDFHILERRKVWDDETETTSKNRNYSFPF